ncbi:hypothetical protein [Micromonospora sp. DH14]|uniref:hypothetical protein n=1 Tax=Micromonospora sp. DH14 TaxID=3040120 RepID=UPI00244183E7|nr:hypothetical protein [Micromonospora sp. DH14]MDG9679082.1 hypothetical protein [Micromonospora sp. DH14]
MLAGTTVVKLKTCHLTETHQSERLIDQVLTYALLAAVAVYLTRDHVLALYPIGALTAELAGVPVDTTKSGNHLAALIQAEHHPPGRLPGSFMVARGTSSS